jgi:hypothetical protein
MGGLTERQSSTGMRGALLIAGACAVWLALLSACSTDASDVAGANIVGYNHTPEYIHQFYVNGARGPNVHPYGGGGGFVCCITYPRQWTPELKATVRWTTSDADPKGSPEETWHETDCANRAIRRHRQHT